MDIRLEPVVVQEVEAELINMFGLFPKTGVSNW